MAETHNTDGLINRFTIQAAECKKCEWKEENTPSFTAMTFSLAGQKQTGERLESENICSSICRCIIFRCLNIVFNCVCDAVSEFDNLFVSNNWNVTVKILSAGPTARALPAARCGERWQRLVPVSDFRDQQQLSRPPELLPSTQDVQHASRNKETY